MAFPRGGPASRTVALDLMLRTFMNSADFQVSNPKIWENIAKFVPGATPQQCAQRWEELRAASSTVVGDFSGLTAQGRPISSHSLHQRRQMTKFVRTMLNSNIPRPENSGDSRPQSVMSLDRPRGAETPRRPATGGGERERIRGGKFVANFCQTVLTGSGRREEEGHGDVRNTSHQDGVIEATRCDSPSGASFSPKSSPSPQDLPQAGAVGENGPNMVIHVCDEAKKLKRDFVCPRDILVKEMRYFAEYLSSDAQLWDEVDISVHCDVPVFDWLMQYAKRGMLEGPCGENLSSPLSAPRLEASNAVSILISSDFLKMDSLVDACLDFCHERISTVVASPCNMGCIPDRLVSRLAGRLSPLEVENIIDKKDKIRSKLFIHQLQQLFKPSYSTPTCPSNAATLHRCKHCGQLLTVEQQSFLPCCPQRVSLGRSGRIVYSHEKDPGWEVNQYIQSLQQQQGMSPRDIYWRLWGIVNWLVCDRCKSPFQCRDLAGCAYHTKPVVVGSTPEYLCCKQPASRFSTLPHWENGCAHRDHTVGSKSTSASVKFKSSERVCSTLLALRDTVCSDERTRGRHMAVEGSWEVCLLRSEERKPEPTHKQLDPQHTNGSDCAAAESITNNPLAHSRQPLAQGVSMATRRKSHDNEEEEEDEPDVPPKLLEQRPKSPKHRNRHAQGQGTVIKHRHSRSDLQSPLVEWLWDSRRSKRWNQDMQRESDEKRLAGLSTQLSQRTSHENTKTREASSYYYAGGVFSRLDTQFRANQAARALTLQNAQHRSQGSGRKK